MCLTTAYLINRTLSSVIGNRTLYQMMYQKLPSYKYFKFLAACVVLTIRIEEETNSLREAGNMSLWVTHMLRKHGDLMTWKKNEFFV